MTAMRAIGILAALLLVVSFVAAPAGAAPVDPVDAAGKWLQTIVAAAKSGDVQGIEAAVAQCVQALRNAVEEVRAQKGSPPGLKVAAQRLQEVLQRHLKVLQGLLQRVPESARPAIEKAIEAAFHGYRVATAALGKGVPQGKPSGPQGRPPGEKHGKGRR